MKRAPHVLFLFVLAIALSACQQLGLATPQTFTEKLAYGYSQNAAIRTSAAQSLQAGTINKSDAQQVLATTDTARSALDEARRFQSTGDTATALGKLQLATGLLQSVQVFLKSKGVN